MVLVFWAGGVCVCALLFVSPSHSEATKNWFKFWKSNKIDTSYLRSKWSSLQIPGVGQSLRLSARAAMPRQATQGLPLNVSSSKLLHTWAIHLGCWHSKGTRRWILVSSSPSLQGCDPRSACCHIQISSWTGSQVSVIDIHWTCYLRYKISSERGNYFPSDRRKDLPYKSIFIGFYLMFVSQT